MAHSKEQGWEYKNCRFSGKLISAIEFLNQNAEETIHISEVKKAIHFAKRHHGDQMRESGLPFYSHPIEVAYMCLRYIYKTDVIVTAILHDVVEDTDVTIDMIKEEFGPRVAEMVSMLTRDRDDGEKLSIEEIFSNIYAKNDKEVMLIKLLDRLHNLETLHVKSSEKQLHTTKETLKNFLILAEVIERPDISDILYSECRRINESIESPDDFQELGQDFKQTSPFSQKNSH